MECYDRPTRPWNFAPTFCAGFFCPKPQKFNKF
jgi:hypothetical protein